MLSMSCEHPDIKEFIEAKTNLDKITHANMSVRFNDEFLKDAEEKKMHKQKFTVHSSAGDYDIEKEIDASAIVDKIAECNWDMGEPGMLFWDRVEKWNLLSNNKDFRFAGVNPCVSGDTPILTDKGYLPIKDLVGKEVNVWNGYEFSSVSPRITGHDQPMCLIKFSDGSELNCTTYHKFILKDGTRVEANSLKVGDKLVKCNFPAIEGKENIEEREAYTSGFFVGDGSESTDRNRKYIRLYDEKRELIDFLNHEKSVYCPSFGGEALTLQKSNFYNKNFVPDAKYSIKTRLDWLAGYIDSDGTLLSDDGGIAISSVNREVLMRAKKMLNTLGCNAWVSIMRPEGNRMLPVNDGTGTKKEYHCQESYRLIICASNVKRLMDLGLNTHRVKLIANPNRDASRFITVTEIADAGICDTVYCFNEPKNHSGIFNGVITAQCAEEPLPRGGSCLLGSMNLAEYVSNETFNYNQYFNDVKIAIKALNAVLFEGLPLHPLEVQRNTVSEWRQVGLGNMGLADALINLGIKYGSDKAVAFSEKAGSTMINAAVQASAELVDSHGTFPKMKSLDGKQSVLKTEFAKENLTEETVDVVMQHGGIANSQLLTTAPTGTLSTMLGISGGIEPIFANSYERTTKSLHGEDVKYKVYTTIVKEYMEKHGLTEEEQLPDFFVTARELDPNQRIKMQAAWQQYIDASISSTVNLPEKTTVDDIRDIYMNAWRAGLKGITVFRENCRRIAILNTTPKKEEEKKTEPETNQEVVKQKVVPEKINNQVIGKKRRLTTGCGSLHCMAFFDPVTGELKETFLSKGSDGGCNNFMNGLSRMISIAARSNVSIYDIVDQMKSTGVCPSYATRRATKKDTSPGSCCPMAVGNALLDMYKEVQLELKTKSVSTYTKVYEQLKDTEENGDICPECGEKLIHEGGCNICKNCGWSKCL